MIEQSDILLFVLDARFLAETRNLPLEEKIRKIGKKLIYVVNKADLAGNLDRKELKQISPHFIISCKQRTGIDRLRVQLQIIVKELRKEVHKEGPVRAGIVGYPNTGKSSVINAILGRKEHARVSPQSGFTKGIQILKLSEGFYLLDTPGIIQESERQGKGNPVKLAAIGVKTYDQIKNPEMIVDSLMKKFPLAFGKFYGIDAQGDSEKLIELFGRKRGFIMKGNIVDEERAAREIIKAFQKSKQFNLK